MDQTTPMKLKPLVNATCKLGKKGCFEDGRCHALANCENKIITNADRIRAMSDEELAEFISNSEINCMMFCPDFKAGCFSTCKHNQGKNFILNWLQSEAE